MAPERNHKLDFLRAVAIVGVLFIHTMNRYPPRNFLENRLALCLTIWAHCGIAAFFFISGCLFKSQRLEPAYLYKKYRRIIIPYTLFSLLALLYQTKGAVMGYLTDNCHIFLGRYLVGGAWGIYYFVFVILVMYTLAYFILSRDRLKKHLPVITLILLALNLLHGAYYDRLVLIHNLADNLFFQVYEDRYLLLWPVYFFAGVLFEKHEGFSQINRYRRPLGLWWAAMFVLLNFILFFGGGFLGCYKNSVMGTFYALAAIAFLLTFEVRHKLITFLSQKTYYLYLSHIFFIYGWMDLSRHYGVEWSFWGNFALIVVALAGPLLLYFPLRLLLKEKSYLIIGA